MYLALYRKYRPKTFDDVISQEHITTTLKNQIKSGQTAHAYLFTGSRGTGKTTCAKILSMAVNCLNPIDGNPCMECAACREIENGASDITEMDAASNNGVDDVRALRDEVMYTPVSCKKRVYIIDEVHMLSMSAFNALLKTLEEPPPHVLFILATTELHKVPATILSRCQRFEFRRINPEDSAKRLEQIAENEGASLDHDAALLISRLSDGGMRDALSILDQCIAIDTRVDTALVRNCAGVPSREYLFRFDAAIAQKDLILCLSLLDELHGLSKDMGRLFDELVGHFRNLMILRSAGDFSLVNALPDEEEQYKAHSAQFTLAEIMRALDAFTDAGERLSKTRNKKIIAEMCFVSLCSARLDKSPESMLIRLEKLEQQSAEFPKVKAIPVMSLEGLGKTLPKAEPLYKPEEEPPKPNVQDDVENNSPEQELAESVPLPDEPFPEEYPDFPPPPQSVAEENEGAEHEQSGVVAERANHARFMRWREVLEALPDNIAGWLDDTDAFTRGNLLIIRCDNAFARMYLSADRGEHLTFIKNKVKQLTGAEYDICFSGEEAKVSSEEPKDKLDELFERAKKLGVKTYRK